jgi:SAM-dependent methyltransferase
MLIKVIDLLRNPSKFKKVPSVVSVEVDTLRHSFNSWINYRRFLKSGKEAITGDLLYDLDVVHLQLTDSGYSPEDYFVDVGAFNEYRARCEGIYHKYKKGFGEFFTEKALEHYVSLSFKPLTSDSKVIDIASAGSPFPEIVHSDYGCDVWSNDLIFPEGVHGNGWHTRVGGDACKLPIEDDFFDLAVLHCALEMFEGEADVGLIREAGRVLKPGGTLVVVPLYLNETCHILRDPRTYRNPLPDIDEGAELVYRKDFYGASFCRVYSVDSFMNRLVENMDRLSLKIYRVRNLAEVDEKCYMHWIAVFQKEDTE